MLIIKLTKDGNPVWLNTDLVVGYYLESAGNTVIETANAMLTVTETPTQIAELIRIAMGLPTTGSGSYIIEGDWNWNTITNAPPASGQVRADNTDNKLIKALKVHFVTSTKIGRASCRERV